MALIVQKFGGTSVGSLERIENAARKVAKAKDKGHDIVVVSSAMAGTPERLISTAKEIKEIHTKKLKELLAKGYIPIVAGFQGVTKDGEITTLGRGGSDTSAVALAAALKADVCEIYTDVDGIYTADPRIVPNAKKIKKIAYEEMLELASLGAKVMQIRSVEFGSKYGVRIHVRSSFKEEEGSWIVPEEEIMEKVAVRGITSSDKEVQFTVVKVPDQPGIAAKIFKALGDAHIAVDMIVQTVSVNGYTVMSFTVPENDAPLAKEIVEAYKESVLFLYFLTLTFLNFKSGSFERGSTLSS